MAQRWYYQILMEEFGPVTELQLQQLMDDETLTADDMIRPEDSVDWMTVASQIHQFRSTALKESVSEPASLTDLTELSFHFEDNTSGADSPSRHSGRFRSSDTPLPSDQDLLFAELPPIVSDSEAELPIRRTRTSEAPNRSDLKSSESPAQYYCQLLGQILGPMPLPDLKEMLSSGSLEPTDLIRRGDDGDWMPSGQFPELSRIVATALESRNAPPEAAHQSGGPLSAPAQTPPAHSDFANRPHTLSAAADNVRAEDATVRPPGSPRPAERQGVSKGMSPAASGAKSKKKRKNQPAKENDAVLDEIFDEVFSDDSSKPAPKPSVVMTPTIPAAIPPAAADATAHAPEPDAIAASESESLAPASSSRNPVAAQISPIKPVRPKAATRSRPSINISGKTLGLVGSAVLVVGLVAGLAMGAIKLPGMNGLLRGDPVTVMLKSQLLLKNANIDSMKADEMQKLQTAILDNVTLAYRDLLANKQRSPKEEAMLEVGKKLREFCYVRFEEKELQKQLVRESDELVAAAPK